MILLGCLQSFGDEVDVTLRRPDAGRRLLGPERVAPSEYPTSGMFAQGALSHGRSLCAVRLTRLFRMSGMRSIGQHFGPYLTLGGP